MCGIAGILHTRAQDQRVIQAMTERQSHRGPDSGGLAFFDPLSTAHYYASDALLPDTLHSRAALGHRRLAIIDTRDHGAQPMQSRSYPHLWISYNGEIYNYLELRATLIAHGAKFTTQTDTEVILQAYALWGTACFEKFRGMWALAIIDTAAQTLTLCRDRFGIKPLYLHRQHDRLAFASEIKALFALDDITPRLNRKAAKSYLLYQLVDHSTSTFFEDITAFAPAHYAVIDFNTPHNITLKRYWHYPTDTLTLDDASATEQFRNIFMASITEHLRADVPLGACLSGGVDSSAIVCATRQLLGDPSRPFATFTATFSEADCNERRWSDLVNDAAHASGHSVSPEAADFLRDLDALIWHQDEPFTSSSIYAQWAVMRRAKEAGIVVLLDGQGADEVFCGYKKFYVAYIRELLKNRAILSALKEIFFYALHGDRGIFRLSDIMRYLPAALRPDMSRITRLMQEEFATLPALDAPKLGAAGSLRERQMLDIAHMSVPSLLRYEDRNSMAFSVESRVPFLDHRLVELGLRLANHQKLRMGRNKSIMRRALCDIIPRAVLKRRDKMGFNAPQKHWLNTVLLPAFSRDIEAGNFALSPLIKRDVLTQYIADNQPQVSTRDARLLFQLYILNRWMYRFHVTP